MAIESGILFAFLAMLCWGFGDFFIQKTTRKIGDIESLAYIGIIGTMALLPFVIKDFSLIFSTSNLLILLLLGIITFVVAMLDFEALREGKLSIIDVVIELELPVTIILSFIFFKETLSIFQFFVISLIFIGIVLIATKSFSHWKTKLEKGVILAVLAAIGMGLINFLTGASSRQVSPLMAVWFPWVIFSILCLFFIYKKKSFVMTENGMIEKRESIKKFIANGVKFKWIILAMGIFDTLAWLFYAFAVFKEEISITTAITESYPAIAMFLGLWLNKEKINWHQYLGAFLALLSSFILALSV